MVEKKTKTQQSEVITKGQIFLYILGFFLVVMVMVFCAPWRWRRVDGRFPPYSLVNSVYGMIIEAKSEISSKNEEVVEMLQSFQESLGGGNKFLIGGKLDKDRVTLIGDEVDVFLSTEMIPIFVKNSYPDLIKNRNFILTYADEVNNNMNFVWKGKQVLKLYFFDELKIKNLSRKKIKLGGQIEYEYVLEKIPERSEKKPRNQWIDDINKGLH